MKDGMPEPMYRLDFVCAQDSLDSAWQDVDVHLVHDVSKAETEELLHQSTSETGSQCDCDCDC